MSRTVTPSKIIEWAKNNSNNNSRNTTPHNKRSLSCTEIRNTTTTRDHYSRIRHPSAAISHRKQRKWDNNHLVTMIEHYAMQGEEKLLELFNNKNNNELSVSLRYNTLSELLKKENNESLLLFLSGYNNNNKNVDSFNNNTYNNKIYKQYIKQFNNNSNESLRAEEIEHYIRSEQSWRNIEKKARNAVIKAYRMNNSRLLLQDIDTIINNYIYDNANNIATTNYGMALSKVLINNLAFDNNNNLIIPFEDCSYYRLLFHGIAQFYNAKSYSTKVVTYANNPGKKIKHNIKVCVLIRPRNNNNTIITTTAEASTATSTDSSSRVSLTKFLVQLLDPQSLIQASSQDNEKAATINSNKKNNAATNSASAITISTSDISDENEAYDDCIREDIASTPTKTQSIDNEYVLITTTSDNTTDINSSSDVSTINKDNENCQ